VTEDCVCGISQLNVGQCQKAFLPSVGAAEKRKGGGCVQPLTATEEYPVSVHFSLFSLRLLFEKMVCAVIKYEIACTASMQQSKVSYIKMSKIHKRLSLVPIEMLQ